MNGTMNTLALTVSTRDGPGSPATPPRQGRDRDDRHQGRSPAERQG